MDNQWLEAEEEAGSGEKPVLNDEATTLKMRAAPFSEEPKPV